MAHSNPTVVLSMRRPTGNFWIDTGLVVLLSQFGEGEHPVNRIKGWIMSKIIQESGNKGEYYDETTQQIREYNKKNWVYPTNLFIKVAGTGGKKTTIDGQQYFTRPPEFDLKLQLAQKAGICDICGDRAPLTDAKMWMYPFVVDAQKFSNFYSYGKRGLHLCARCALAGLAAYQGWLWTAQGRDALHFFIFHSDLEEMVRLYSEVLTPIMLSGSKSGNTPLDFSGPYLHESALGLLLRLFSLVRTRTSDNLSEEERQILAQLLGATAVPAPPVILYAISGKTSSSGKPSQVFDMTDLREFSRLHDLFRLYERWLEAMSKVDKNPHERLVMVFRQFQVQQRKGWESLWRDRVAWAVLTFDDPFPFIEQFLYEVRAREEKEKRRPLVRGTLDVFAQYAREVMAMDEQFHRTLAGFGHNLGEKAHEHNEMGLLYELRNAKNPETFYRVLNNVQFRLKTTVPEALLRIEKGERIVGTSWMRVKTILAIYAMNAFLLKESAQTGQLPAKEEGQG